MTKKRGLSDAMIEACVGVVYHDRKGVSCDNRENNVFICDKRVERLNEREVRKYAERRRKQK